jgi:kynurenine formamidase
LSNPDNIGRYLGIKTGSCRVKSIYLAGHSCGAHILSYMVFLLPNIQISQGTLTDSEYDTTWSSDERNKMAQLLPKIKGLAFLDGIYDLSDMLDEYPGYEFFVEKAFGTGGEAGEDWDKACVPKQAVEDLPSETCDWLKSREGPKLFVAHAMEDELLTERQSLGWYKWLTTLVGESGRLAYDNSTLIGSHDGSLQHEGLGHLLAKLVNQA